MITSLCGVVPVPFHKLLKGRLSMAHMIQSNLWGIDVAKTHMDSDSYPSGKAVRIDNHTAAIKTWLRQLPPKACLAVEATNSYHFELIKQAQRLGIEVYLINAYQLSRYREALGIRAKTDFNDAQLLARYLHRERDQLRPHRPLSQAQQRFWRLLRRRAKVVQITTQLRLSLNDLGTLGPTLKATLRQLNHLAQLIEKRLKQISLSLGWWPTCQRLTAIYGIGNLTAMALVAGYHRGTFTQANAFVAYLGLDLQVRDSGTRQGRRKLSKQGDRECRRLLFNAARTAARGPVHQPYYQTMINRGMATTQATVALSRKLVRIAFALIKSGDQYQPKTA